MANQHQVDRAKLKEAILFIAGYCPPEELGNVKLHKILYFSDMMFFIQEGRPLTGADYLKQKFGPVARLLSSALLELRAEGRIQVTEEEYFGLYKKTYRPIHPYSPERLSENEIALLKEVSDFVRGKNAKEISELSHNAAWEMMDMGEVIPYCSALQLVPNEIDDSDRQWALDSAQEYASVPFA